MYARHLRQVAQAIETHSRRKVGFNMAGYCQTRGFVDKSGYECGTTACVAGWAALESGLTFAQLKKTPQAKIHDIGQKFLGLTDEEARQLFVPGDGESRTKVEVEDAVATLRLAAITKRIKWFQVSAELD